MCRISERWQTDESGKVVVVCNDGQGIKDFKIDHCGDGYVDVTFSLCKVKTTEIKSWDWKDDGVVIRQSYYVLDTNTKKIVRSTVVGAGARFSKSFKKTVLMFGIWSDVEFRIEEKDSEEHIIRAYDVETGEEILSAATLRWVGGSREADDGLDFSVISVVDFVNGKIHNLQSLQILN